LFGNHRFCFKVDTHYQRAPRKVEVNWHPPIHNWVQCNTDDTTLGSLGLAACVEIFENNHGKSLGCFGSNLSIANAPFAEFMGIILAVELAFQKNWLNCGLKVIQNLLLWP
jgi:hypothetical protein